MYSKANLSAGAPSGGRKRVHLLALCQVKSKKKDMLPHPEVTCTCPDSLGVVNIYVTLLALLSFGVNKYVFYSRVIRDGINPASRRI